MSSQSEQDYVFELARRGAQLKDWRYWKKMAEDYNIALVHIRAQSEDAISRDLAAAALAKHR